MMSSKLPSPLLWNCRQFANTTKKASGPARLGGVGHSCPTKLRMIQTPTQFERLVLDIGAFAARITLRNQPVNIIDIPMMDELSAALAKIESRPEISVIIIRGEGNCFSAGVDVAAHTSDKVAAM